MENSLKVLMIGSDRKLFEEGSAVSERIKEYGRLVGELHIVVFTTSAHHSKFPPEERAGKIQNSELKLSDNVWVYPTVSLSRWFYIFDATRLGRKLIFEKGFIRGRSIITTQDPFECGLAGLLVKRKWRLPLEVQLHTDPFSPYFSGVLNWIRKIIAKRVLRSADGIRVVSEHLKQAISTYNPSASISVLPIYIDRERIENAQISFDLHARFGWKFIMLSVARLTPEKNLGLAIRVLALARKSFPDIGLVVVGAGSEGAKLKLLAWKLGLSHNVAFVGWQNDLASYYKTANIFIQTSRFEGYGMALVEAGLSGLPVITTPVGLGAELEHGRDAYVYDSDKPEPFVAGVLDLITHNHKRENLKVNLKKTIEDKLLSKESYLAKMRENWEQVSARI